MYHMGGKLGAHVILVVVGGQHRIHLLYGKGIQHKGHSPQVGLHSPGPAHVGHLVSRGHFAVSMGALAVAAPQVYRNISASGGFKPDACTAQPPHGNCARLYLCLLNFLVQPRPPLREGAHNPAFPAYFVNFAHPNHPFCCSLQAGLAAPHPAQRDSFIKKAPLGILKKFPLFIHKPSVQAGEHGYSVTLPARNRHWLHAYGNSACPAWPGGQAVSEGSAFPPGPPFWQPPPAPQRYAQPLPHPCPR